METKYTDYMAWVKAGEALSLTNHRLQGHSHFEFRDKDGYVFGRWSENHGHLDPDARKNQLSSVRTEPLAPLPAAALGPGVPVAPPGVPVKLAPVPPPHPIAPVVPAPVSPAVKP